MAYMDFFNTGSFNPLAAMNMFGAPGETEEERRRREEQELLRQQEEQRQRDLLAQQRQQEQMLIAGPVAPALAPQLGQTESEVTPGYQPQPFKQTLITDPVTGQQKLKMEGAPQDFTSANPYTPTIAGPMAPGGMTGPTPEEIMRDQEQRRQYEIMMAQPQAMAAPVVTGPAEPTMLARAPTTTMTDVTASTTGPVVPPGQAINPETGELYTPVPAAGRAPSAAPAAGGGAVLPVSTTVTAPAPSPADVAQRQMMAQDIQEGPVVRQAVAEGAGPAAMQWFNIITAAQRDPAAMERIARDPNTPEQWRRVAASQSRMTLEQKREREQAEAEAQRIIATGDTSLARKMAKKEGDEGSALKLAMYEFLFGANSNLAKLEARKLDLTWDQDQDEAGNTVLIQRRGDGKAMQGIGADQQPMSDKELTKYSGGATGVGGRGAGFQKGEFMVDELGRPFQTAFNPNNPRRPIITPIGHNERPQGTLVRSTQSGVLAADVQASKKQVDLQFDPKIRTMVKASELAVENNAKYGTNVGVVGMDDQNRPIYVDNNTGKIIKPNAQGQAQATSTRGGPAGVGIDGTAAAEKEIKLQTVEAEENIKSNNVIANETAKKARQTSGQLTTLDRVIAATQNTPQFFGDWIGGDAFRMFVAAKTSAEERDALDRIAQLANIRDPKDREKFQSLLNDIRRLELDGITGSGLSAQQLNTPPESERAVRAFAVNIRDSAKAAQAQALIARATVEYNREFNRYMATANKRLSPAALADDFNAKIGDRIFNDLQRKLGIRDYTGGGR